MISNNRTGDVFHSGLFIKLSEKYTPEKLEAACEKALLYSSSPSYKSIKNLLVTMKDTPIASSGPQKKESHGITRGARYYGGNRS